MATASKERRLNGVAKVTTKRSTGWVEEDSLLCPAYKDCLFTVSQTIIRMTRVPLLLMLLFTVGCHWLGLGAENPAKGFFTPGEIDLTFIAILTLVVASIALYPPFMEMWKRPARPFPYFFESHDLNKLTRVLFPGKRIENYVKRNQLLALLGPTLMPGRSRILIYGLSGVGKTREGVELVRRLGRKAIYLSTTGSPEVPALLEPEHPRQKVAL